MSATLPDSIRVGYLNYAVETYHPISATAHAKHGEHSPLEQKIRLHEDQTPQQMANTIIHEVLHAIFYQSGIRNVAPEHIGEELIVDSLSNGLCQVFQDNPKLLEYIMLQLGDGNAVSGQA